MDKEEADMCTASYLKEFRKCPDHISMSLDQWRSELWNNALPPKYKHLSYEIYQQWLQYRYHYLELPTELVQMLRQLRKNYLLVIITNGPSNAQWEKIHKLGFNMGKNSLFDCILVSADCGFEKPDRRIFETACNYLGILPQNCIMVGDKLESDIKGGKLANLLATVWIPLNFPATVEPNGSIVPDITLSSIYELKSLLIVDDQPQQQLTGGNARSLKLKASRSIMSNGPLSLSSSTSSSSSSPSSTNSAPFASTGCFSSSSSKAKNITPYPRRFLSPPIPIDLDNDASNQSDGS
ncbi:hypothetical protein PVAND_003911 [Polypedilum vanderplanki]|uniref:N-acylneuraminate-9-phosphatase n=1 Tax=Polypedilum vanderplanki TaxID=319348 RepID=A0A9J6BXF0_POLVA|nr:hypothetical protein PVAND_003911 [Polypedilum vanderplanki]